MRRYVLLLVLALGLTVAVPCTSSAGDSAPYDDDSAEVLSDDDSAAETVTVIEVVPDTSEVELEEATDEEAIGAMLLLTSPKGVGIAGILAAILTLLVWVFRKMTALGKVPKKWVPWLTIGLAMLTDIVASLALGIPWHAAVIEGLAIGSAAIAFWEAAAKHLLKKPE